MQDLACDVLRTGDSERDHPERPGAASPGLKQGARLDLQVEAAAGEGS
jgi:hypothetical protein